MRTLCRRASESHLPSWCKALSMGSLEIIVSSLSLGLFFHSSSCCRRVRRGGWAAGGNGSLKFLNKKGLDVVEFCCAGVVWNHPGTRSIYVYRFVKGSRSVRKPGSAQGINFPLICHGFKRRNHDAFVVGIGTDSKCAANTVRHTKRLYFHRKTVTAKSEYCRYFWSYRFYSALRKHPFFHFGKFDLFRVRRHRSLS
jgi:hypothetical protein